MQYYYDHLTNKCTAWELTGEFPQIQIPDDADYTSTDLLGSQAINTFAWEDNNTYDIVSVTDSTCFPISFEQCT